MKKTKLKQYNEETACTRKSGKMEKIILQCTILFFLAGIFCVWMVSMNSHSWRGNPEFMIGVPPMFDIHHGLWYKCIKEDGSCEKLKEDPNDTDSTTRGNTTRALLGAAILFIFISTGLLFINIFVKKENLHLYTVVACLILQILALITGFAAMINFHDYFKTPNDFKIELINGRPTQVGSPWSEYRYGYKLGWAGSGLMFIPVILTFFHLVLIKRH